MFKKHKPTFCSQASLYGFQPHKRGMTLIVVLSFLVLLSGAILGFYANSSRIAKASSDYTANLLTDQIAINHRYLVISMIQKEIEENSTKVFSSTSSGSKTAKNNFKFLPKKTEGFRLMKPSSNDEIFDPQFPSLSLSSLKIQDWILNKQISPNESSSNSHAKTLLDRYAFAIYNQGGMIDANVVGSREQKNLTLLGRKGGLFRFKGVDDSDSSLNDRIISKIATWRHKTEPLSSEQYLQKIGFKNGFMATTQNSKSFLTRKELLDFLNENDEARSARFLTHFSRDYNLPSWYPEENKTANARFRYASEFQFRYNDESNQSYNASRRMYNRDFSLLINREGESLMKRRFPLSRLAVFETGSEKKEATSSEIYEWFGMTKGADGIWTYDHGARDRDGNTKIYQLNDPEFLAQNREPDFFELLQAGILYGSTGLTVNSSDALDPLGNLETLGLTADIMDIKTPIQILKIGLNLIDQWDSDHLPTALKIKGRKYLDPLPTTSTSLYANGKDVLLAGQESMPYLSEIYHTAYRPTSGQMGNNAGRDGAHYWLEFEVWNPYRIDPNNRQPMPQVKIAAESGHLRISANSNSYIAPPSAGSLFRRFSSNHRNFSTNPSSILLNPNTKTLSSWDRPTFLSQTEVSSENVSDSKNFFSDSGLSQTHNKRVGLFVTSLFMPTSANTPSPAPSGWGDFGKQNLPPFTFQYQTRTAPQYAPPFGNLTNTWPGGEAAPFTLNNGTVNSVAFSAGISTLGGTSANIYNAQSNSFFLNYYVQSSSSPSSWILIDGLWGFGNRQTILPGDTLIESNSWFLQNNFLDLTRRSGLLAAGHPQVYRPITRPDPRTPRFGFSTVHAGTQMGDHPRMNMPLTDPYRDSSGYNCFYFYEAYQTGFCFFPLKTQTDSRTSTANLQTNPYIGDYADNRSRIARVQSRGGTQTYYTDLDGEIRIGDGDSYYNVFPNDYSIEHTRPIILNRRFYSVAEMAYAYRDLPWKTLDFRSANSADAALLDLFSLEEEPLITAGKIDLNSASEDILKGLISATHTDPFYQKSITDPSPFIQSLKKNDFIFKSRADIPKAIELYYPLSSSEDQAIKHRREAIARGLVDSSQTRTWNLMIDLVSQVGVPHTQSQEFVKQRTHRQWIHLAIDRITGKVIDFQVEETY